MASRSGARHGGWRVVAAVVGALALSVTSACSGPEAQWQPPGGASPTTAEAPPKLPAKLNFTVESGAVDVSPAALVAVTVSNGSFDAVSLTDADGAQVAGGLDAAKVAWKNSEALAYNSRYTLTATSTGEDGKPVQETRTFTTVKPRNYTMPYIRAYRNGGPLLDGGTFGIGQPVVIQFDEPVPDRAAAERALTVTTDPPTAGAWRWMFDDEVHWRPKEYWTPGTKVQVVAKVYGANLGNGLFGQEDRTASFTIGPSRIAIADHDTHRMQIFISGVDVTRSLSDTYNANLPGSDYDHSEGAKISMGAQGDRDSKGNWFDMRTSSGPHVVMEKSELVIMKPSLPPTDRLYYSTPVPMAVRITASGEYVHWADWSLSDQGIRNVSHGCINMSPNDATWFFNNFGYGDIVDVKNTGKQMGVHDGLGDWNLSWEEWTGAAG
jgi:lipoprotein-anchoring transpeptidase ErfK/SrfK